MVHFTGDLLAAGFAGADSVSIRMVDPTAVSDRGNRSGGSSRFVEGHIVFAGKDFARPATGVVAVLFENFPQCLKPPTPPVLYGTTEVVP